jgi:glyoxylase-like metal-dependent hydrolase (beta-lactamase superfamily II)
MTHDTRRVGRFEITAIMDADMPDEPIADAFPAIPAEALLTAKATYPGIYTEDDRWRLRIRSWVVRDDAGCLLLDTGIGGAGSPTQEWAPRVGALTSGLQELCIGLGDIDRVVISHVHDDHIGGLLTDDGRPICPNARYIVQRADVEWQRAAGARGSYAASVWHLLGAIEDAGVMDAVAGDHVIADGLALRHLPGHTPGHQILIVADDGSRMVLSADTWNHPIQVGNPEWPSGPDDDHAAAATARRTLLADLEAHPGTIVAPTHFAESFGEVRDVGGGRAWAPA